MSALYSDRVGSMDETAYGTPEGATLKSIRRAFRVSRERSIARHNAQLTHRAVKRHARRSLRYDASMVGLMVVIVFIFFQIARMFVG